MTVLSAFSGIDKGNNMVTLEVWMYTAAILISAATGFLSGWIFCRIFYEEKTWKATNSEPLA